MSSAPDGSRWPDLPPGISGKALVDAIDLPVVLYRQDALLYANAAFSALCLDGLSIDRGAGIVGIAAPEYRAAVDEHVRRSLESTEARPANCEFRLAAPADAERWVELRPRRVRIDGIPTLLATCQDTTTYRRLVAQRHQLLEMHRQTQRTLREILDGDPVPTFVIDAHHVITHWNKACEAIIGMPASEMVGTRNQWKAFYREQRPTMADIMVDGGLEGSVSAYYAGKYRPSSSIPGAFEAEDFFPHMGSSGRWLHFTAAPVRDQSGTIVGAIETLQDISERRQAEEALRSSQLELEILVEQRTAQLRAAKAELESDIQKRQHAEEELLNRYVELTELNIKLSDTNLQLEEAHNQLLQSEKMASIGQLAAGVAHEINNPIGYVFSNLGALDGYLRQTFELVDALGAAAPEAGERLRRQFDFDYIREDLPALMQEFREGITRVRKIVEDLRDFSRVDQSQEWQFADLHQGIESTLNIASNEIKYKADVIREYGDIPEIECLPSQLNQVFMNLLVNAAQAIESQRGTITIRSGRTGDRVWIEITDTGSGIPESILHRIFDPFFTTKPVGKGTGLGLSLSYGIVKKHQGEIEVSSTPGVGTTFRISLPIKQQENASS